MTRQRAWQLRKVADGCCKICGKPRQQYADQCDDCKVKDKLRVGV